VKEVTMGQEDNKCAQNFGGTPCYAEKEMGGERNWLRVVTKTA
jgi:hypothetical protein